MKHNLPHNHNHLKAAAPKPTAKDAPIKIPAWLSKAALPLIILLTMGIYGDGVLHNKMLIDWIDDNANIVSNIDIRQLSLDNLKNWFTKTYVEMYCPIKMAVHALEYALWGINPVGYHAVSLLMHCLNTLMVFYLLFWLIGSRRGACVAALLFAIHPMAVEPVAWASGRGDVQCTMFYLAALICYYKYRLAGRQPSHPKRLQRWWFTGRWMLFAWLFFAMSSMSKVSGITLPVLMLLMDVYQGRINWKRKQLISGNWKLVVEKLPFLAVSLALGLKVLSERGDDVFAPLSTAIYSTAFYIAKFVAPVQQSIIYPNIVLYETASVQYYPFVLLGAALLFVFCKRQRKAMLFGFGFFLITASLVLVPIKTGLANDRYAYLPYIGFYFIVAHMLASSIVLHKRWLWVVLLGIVGIFTYRSHQMNKVWYDEMALCQNYMKNTPDFGDPYYYVADLYGKRRNYDTALKIALKGTKAKYKSYKAYIAAGEVFAVTDRYDDAITYLNIAQSLDTSISNYQEVWVNKVKTYMWSSQLDSLDKYLQKFTDTSMVWYNVQHIYRVAQGKAYAAFHKNDFETTVKELNEAESIKPLDSDGYWWRAAANINLTRFAEVIPDLDQLLLLDSTNVSHYIWRAKMYLELNQPEDARRDYNKLLQLAPDNEEVHTLEQSLRP
ncbi:hypothetical protein AGMMS4956_03570 [Bacteroidia bacterium]|nr:hypothetical protein AGMMS4956_03570 [Bacteroidia bacterium]